MTYSQTFSRSVAASVLIVAFGSINADAGMIWDESVGPNADAGFLTGDAHVTAGTGQLAEIKGTFLLGLADGQEDIDMFKVKISDTDAFSAKVFAPPNGPPTPLGPVSDLVDSFLFVFNENGVAVIADNNSPEAISGGALSEIEAGALSGLTAGYSFIAITYGIEPDLPVDASGNPLFDAFELFDDVDLPPFLPAIPGVSADGNVSPISTAVMTDWNFGPDGPDSGIAPGAESGPYSIVLTGAQFAEESVIPEPASVAIWSLLGVSTLGLRRRVKRRA